MRPVVGIDARHVTHAIDILEFGRFRCDQHIERLAAACGIIGPIGLDRIPEGFQAFLIGIAVLDDERADALRMLQCKPVSNRRTIIHDVHGVAHHLELLEQAVHEIGIMAEAVVEGRVIRRGAAAETRIVRRDDMVFVGKKRYQIAEHVRRCRESVQQHDGRSVGRPSFAIENLDPVHCRCSVVRDRCQVALCIV